MGLTTSKSLIEGGTARGCGCVMGSRRGDNARGPSDPAVEDCLRWWLIAMDMAGEENSVVVSTGDVIGDCKASGPMERRGLFVLNGEAGGGWCIVRAGDCCRLDKTLGRIKLLRFRSLELATLLRPSSELAGESARRGPDSTDDRILVSLSMPASLSKCMDLRLLWLAMLIGPACDLGV